MSSKNEVKKFDWKRWTRKQNWLRSFAYLLLIVAVLLTGWFLFFGGYMNGNPFMPDVEKAKDIQPFITGLVLPLLTLGSTLFVIETLRTNTMQNFSNNFFKLIDQHHKLVDNILSEVSEVSTSEQPSKGRIFFDDLAQRIANDYSGLKDDPIEVKCSIDEDLKKIATGKTKKDLLVCIYDYHFHIHQSDLGHYFRNLYHIVKYVERSTIKEKEKFEFLRMLRAQLSNYEILLLAYNGLHEYGEDFYPLIEKFELLKSLNNETRVPENYIRRIVEIDVLIGEYKHLKHWEKNKKTP